MTTTSTSEPRITLYSPGFIDGRWSEYKHPDGSAATREDYQAFEKFQAAETARKNIRTQVEVIKQALRELKEEGFSFT